MKMLNKSRPMLSGIAYSLFLFSLMLLSGIAYSSEQIILEFLYWDPSSYCNVYACPSLDRLYQDFLAKNYTMNCIQEDYKDKVIFKWIDITSKEGIEKKQLYNITFSPLYAIVINGKLVSQGDDFNETYVREAIELALKDFSMLAQASKPLGIILVSAFSFGFFETFSPCLIALLAFILSHTMGKTVVFKDGFLRVMAFGVGFVSATLLVLLGLAAGLILVSPMLAFQNALMWIVCIFAILFGLDLLGFNVLNFLKNTIDTKPLVRKLARQYAFTYTGIIALGFLFYFLDPCLTPVFVAMMGTFPQTLLMGLLPLILLMFCLGVIIPFLGIGLFAASISQLTRSTYRHRSKIRAISGLILIVYAFYIIIFRFIL